MAKQEIVEVKRTEMALPADLMAALGAEAKEAAATERPAVSKLSTAQGILRYMGEAVAGNNMDVIVMYASHRNVWFSGSYNKDNIKNPDCFALAETDEGMVPQAANPVSPTCDGCPKNAWGSDVKSDGTKGKGKACKQSRRLVLMPAGAVESVDAVKRAELALLDLPVTSAKNYGGFVNTVASTAGVPGWAVVSNVKVQPSKNQFEIILTPLKVLPSADIVMAVKSRLEDAKRLALEPYDETSPTNSAVIAAQKSAAEENRKF